MHAATGTSSTSRAPGGAARNAIELFNRRVQRSGPRISMRYKQNGTWRTMTWNDWDRAAREVAGGLRALGLQTGDRVCVLANTRWEWVACDVGILLGGGVTVPIYQSNLPDQVEYIVNDCGAKVVIVEDRQQLDKLLAHKAAGKLAARVIMMEGEAAEPWVTSFAELRTAGAKWLGGHAGALERAWDEVSPEHVFTIVYTSGTTGPPKGVVLLHRNIAFECAALDRALSISEADEQLLFLPLAHIFARILEWTSISRGASIAFAENLAQLIANMKEVRPTFMGAVPRVYEKAYVKIRAGLDDKRKSSPVARTLVDWALGVGKQVSRERAAGRAPSPALALQARLADRLMFDKLRATFGGRLRWFISGGAPLAKEIQEFFHSAGLLILEGYGLTETTAATHVNRPNAYRFGTVGQALAGVEVKIAGDGEILMRGDNILREYWGKPEATKEAIDGEGWFHSGDIGVIEDGGFLKITDRKKDLIVTAGGKNVAPQNLEGALKAQAPLVSQVVVIGDKRPYLTALVTLNEETAGGLSPEQARKAVQAEVDKLNRGLASYETIKKFTLLARDFSQDTGELTPTLKVKRKFVNEKYQAEIAALYD